MHNDDRWARNWIAWAVCLLYLGVLGVLFWWDDRSLLPYAVLFLGRVHIITFIHY